MARYAWGYDAMRRAILLMSIGLCGCGTADDEFRVLSYTPAGIEYSVWTGAHSREVVTDMAQQYCQREGKKAQIIDSEVAEKHILRAVESSTASTASVSYLGSVCRHAPLARSCGLRSIAGERRSNRDWIPVPDFAGGRTSRPYRGRCNGASAARISRAARLDRAAAPACP